jgi:rhodanese-related sulfurtransferase
MKESSPRQRRHSGGLQGCLDPAGSKGMGAEQGAPSVNMILLAVAHRLQLIAYAKNSQRPIFANANIARAKKGVSMTKEISRATVAEAILAENPPIVLEALPRRHYEAGHIPGARALPLDEVAKTLGKLVPQKDAAVIVYCASSTCRNSHQAAEWLSARGYANVAVYSGGKQDWVEGGLRLER